MKSLWLIASAIIALALLVQPGAAFQKEKVIEKVVQTQGGKAILQYVEIVEGKGKEAKSGDNVEVHYTGWLTDGKKFDSSVDRGETFKIPVGAGKVIKGWDEGIPGMKEGGKRKLIIPPELAYGAKGVGNGLIPGNATLVFEIELIKVK